MRVLRLASGAIMLAALLAPVVAQAQDTAQVRRLTILTFSEPVQLPGKTLPAGKYRFEMADINNAPHVVRVLSEDGQTVLGTFPTVPSTLPQRGLPDQETLIMFSERPAGQPQAAREWFYPGRSIGEEFVYPKDQAILIAKANKTSVATQQNGSVVHVDGDEQVAENSSAPAANPSPAQGAAPAQSSARNAPAQSSQPSQSAANRAPAPAVGTSGQAPAPAGQTPAPEQTPRTLPQTASQLYLFGLLGVLSIGAAFGIRRLRLRAARG